MRTCTRAVPAPVAVLTFLPIVRSPFERHRGINRQIEAPEPSPSKRLSHRTEHMVGPETISLTPRYESGPSPDSYCAPRLAACCRHGSPSKALQLHAWACTCPDGSRSPNSFSYTAAGPGIGMCGTKYWYRYSVPLLSPTHLQGDEDGSNGECPVGQSRLAQQSAARGGKRIREEKSHLGRKERKSPVLVIGITELCEGLGLLIKPPCCCILLLPSQAMPFLGP